MKISEVGEHALIARIRERAGADPAWVRIGIGDDAAVIEPARGELDVITTDCQIEDVHFTRASMTFAEIGAKALAVNVSDLAAMAADPRAATLSLALPPALPLADFDALIGGFLEVARAARVTLVGGNLSSSPGPIMIDVTLIGSVRRRRVLTRSGGAAGHLLYVTGALGRAAFTGARAVLLLKLAREIAANRAATACMDLSDGLADAVTQVAAASGTGAQVRSSEIPVDSGATLDQALHRGEDYELLFAVAPRRRRGFEKIAARMTTVTCIGELTAAREVVLEHDGPDGAARWTEALGGGFTHFQA